MTTMTATGMGGQHPFGQHPFGQRPGGNVGIAARGATLAAAGGVELMGEAAALVEDGGVRYYADGVGCGCGVGNLAAEGGCEHQAAVGFAVVGGVPAGARGTAA